MGSHKVEQRQGMNLFSIEHSRAVYWADFALYASAVSVFSVLLLVASPRGEWPVSAGLVALGLAGWTIIEYVLHRFVLHGVAPFRHWHAQHHQRPTALISAPTLLSASLIAAGVFVPALWWGGLWHATAFTLGLLAGYLSYAVVHHATHHARTHSAWLAHRKRWHARHHHGGTEHGCCYGVTTGLWDHVFGSAACAVSRASVCQRTYAAPAWVHDGDARTEGPATARPPTTEPTHEPH